MSKTNSKKQLSKALALIMAMLILVSLVPLSALADYWTVNPQKTSDRIYYYDGVTVPAGRVGIHGPADGGQSKDQWPDIQQYILKNLNDTTQVTTYCSDLTIIPKINDRGTVADYLYERVPIENLLAERKNNANFFGATEADFKTRSEKLRSILMNSDLWEGNTLAVMKANALAWTGANLTDLRELPNLTDTDVISAVQAAIWVTVNNAKLLSDNLLTEPAYAYYRYLINLAGTPVGAMTQLSVEKVEKISTGNTYTALVTFELTGAGATGQPSIKVSDVTATYWKDGSKISAPVSATVSIADAGAGGGRQVQVTGIPNDTTVRLEVAFKTTTKHPNVYLYRTEKVINSQTLVSVINEQMNLSTSVEVSNATHLNKLEIIKNWNNIRGAAVTPLSNLAAEAYNAEFVITYAGGASDGFDGLKLDEFKITGNGSYETKMIFEPNRVYKIAEVKVNGVAVPAAEQQWKTFRFVVDGTAPNYKVEWIAAGGGANKNDGNTFKNNLEASTGGVKVIKSVTGVPEGKQGTDEFTFKIEYNRGGNWYAYAGEAFSLNGTASKTGTDGTFKLKADQYAVFSEIPVNTQIRVTETADPRYSSSVSIANGIQTIAKDTTKDITFTNAYKTAELKLSKDIVAGATDVTWAKFAAKGIDFTVNVYTDAGRNNLEYTKVVNLKDNNVVTLTVPANSYYTITETNGDSGNTAKLSGYSLVTTNNGTTSESNGAVAKGSVPATVKFTNTYSSGSLTIVKEKVVNDTEFTPEQKTQVEGFKTFNFTLYKGTSTSGTKIDDYSINLDITDRVTINNLATGDYYLVETNKSAVTADGVRLSVEGEGTVNVGANTSKTVTNTYQLTGGKLTLKKTIAGPTAATNQVTDVWFRVVGSGTAASFGTQYFKIAGTGTSRSLTIDVPVGTYTVTEVRAADENKPATGTGYADYIEVTNYTVAVTVDKVSVTVADTKTETVTITNTYAIKKASVSFIKNVVGGAFGDSFKFTVTGAGTLQTTNASNSGYVSATGATVSVSDGVITLSNVSDTATVTIANLSAGSNVTVVENLTENQKEYFTVYPANGTLTGKVPETGTADLGTITNTRAAKFSLTVVKELVGATWTDFTDGIGIKITGPAGWGDKFLTGGSAEIPGGIFVRDGSSTTTYIIYLKGMGNASASQIFAEIPAGYYTFEEITGTAKGTADIQFRSRKTSYRFGSSGGYLDFGTDGTGTPKIASAIRKTTTTVTFKNEYSVKDGGVGFEKQFTHGFVPATYKFEFKFTSDEAGNNLVSVQNGATVTPADKFSWNTGTNSGSICTVTIVAAKASDLSDIKFTGIPQGTYVTVSELDIDGNYFSGHAAGSGAMTGQVGAGGLTLTIRNTNKMTGKLDVTKTVVNGDDNKEFTFILKVNGNVWKTAPTGATMNTSTGEFKLKHDQKASFTGLPVGVPYEVIETSDSQYTTTPGLNQIGTITPASATTPIVVEYTNTRVTGGVTIAKTVDGTASSSYTGKDFTFTITGLPSGTFHYKVTEGGTEKSSGTIANSGVIILKHGQTATITGIPTGTSVTVTETYNHTESATVTYTVKNDLNETNTATKSVTSGGVSFAFTNTFTTIQAKLTVKKIVNVTQNSWDTNVFPKATKEYTLTLTKGGTAVAGKTGNISVGGTVTTGADGTFKIKDGQTIVFEGLEVGTYSIVEAAPTDVPGFTFTSTVAGGANVAVTGDGKIVDKNSNPIFTVTNAYTRDTGSLTVNKVVAGITTTRDFTLTLKMGSNIVANQAFTSSDATRVPSSLTTDANGKFTIKAGETVTFANMPTGSYTVEEADANIDGYGWVVAYNDADTCAPVIVGASAVAIKVTNTYTEKFGNLAIAKNIGEDDELKSSAWEYNFSIVGPVANWGADFVTAGLLVKDTNDTSDLTYTFSLSNTARQLDLKHTRIGNYTITELSGTGTDTTTLLSYNWKVSVAGGTVVADSDNKAVIFAVTEAAAPEEGAALTADVTFTNWFERHKGSMLLKKTLKGIAPKVAENVEYKFEIVGNDTTNAGFTYPGTIKGSSGLWYLDGIELPTGKYRIRESTTGIAIDDYTFKGLKFFDASDENSKKELKAVTGEEGWFEFTVTNNTAITIECINEYEKDPVEIRVTKKVTGFAGTDMFQFEISSPDEKIMDRGQLNYWLLDANGDRVTADKDLNGTVDPDEWYEGAAYLNAGKTAFEFAIPAEHTALFFGLEPGVEYTVAEILDGHYTYDKVEGESYRINDSYVEINDTTETLTDDNDTDTAITATMKTRNAAGENPAMRFVFTNVRKTGDLLLSKTVVGPQYNTEELFEFKISFTEGTGGIAKAADFFGGLGFFAEDTDGDFTVAFDTTRVALSADGNDIIVKLYKGEKVYISGIPHGLKYSISETSIGDIYLSKSSGKSKEVGDDTAVCEFTNTRNYGKLNIMKKVYARDIEGRDINRLMFNIEVVFTLNSNASVVDYAAIRDGIDNGELFVFLTNGTGTIASGPTLDTTNGTVTMVVEISRDKTVDIVKIPTGSTYTVTELNPGDFTPLYTNTDKNARVDAVIEGDESKAHNESDSVVIYNFEVPEDTIMFSKARVVASPNSPRLTDKYEFVVSLTVPGDPSLYNDRLIRAELIKVTDAISVLAPIVSDLEAAVETNKDDRALLRVAIDIAKSDRDAAIEAIETFTAGDEFYDDCIPCDHDGWVDGNCIECGGSGHDECPDCYGVAPVCGTCDGTDTECTECGGVAKVCPTCGGIAPDCGNGCTAGKIENSETCTDCNGEGKVVNAAGLAEIDAINETYNNDFGADEATLNGYDAEADELAAKAELLAKLKAAKATLEGDRDNGVAPKLVMIDVTTGDETPYEPGVTLFPIEIGQVQIVNAEGEVDVIDGKNFIANANGTYSIFLAVGEIASINELPADTAYTITEIIDEFRTPEDFLGAFDDEKKSPDNGDAPIPDNTVNGILVGDKEQNIHMFYNWFEVLFGNLNIKKVWGGDGTPGSASVTITVYKDDIYYTTVVLEAPNWEETIDVELGHHYSVQEMDCPAGYTVRYTNNGIVLDYNNREGTITVNNYEIPPESWEPSTPPSDGPSDGPSDEPSTPPSDEPSIPPSDEDFEDEDVPLDPGDEDEIIDEDIPLGPLPETGGAGVGIFGLLGVALMGLGLLIGRKKKDEVTEGDE